MLLVQCNSNSIYYSAFVYATILFNAEYLYFNRETITVDHQHQLFLATLLIMMPLFMQTFQTMCVIIVGLIMTEKLVVTSLIQGIIVQKCSEIWIILNLKIVGPFP